MLDPSSCRSANIAVRNFLSTDVTGEGRIARGLWSARSGAPSPFDGALNSPKIISRSHQCPQWVDAVEKVSKTKLWN